MEIDGARIAEIKERRADNFRELGNDEWRVQYASDIDFLLSALEAVRGEAERMKSAMLAKLWDIQTSRVADEAPEETMKIDAFLSALAVELEKVEIPTVTAGETTKAVAGVFEVVAPGTKESEWPT